MITRYVVHYWQIKRGSRCCSSAVAVLDGNDHGHLHRVNHFVEPMNNNLLLYIIGPRRFLHSTRAHYKFGPIIWHWYQTCIKTENDVPSTTTTFLLQNRWWATRIILHLEWNDWKLWLVEGNHSQLILNLYEIFSTTNSTRQSGSLSEHCEHPYCWHRGWLIFNPFLIFKFGLHW